MTAPEDPLEAHLRRMLHGLDTSAGFDERVRASVRAEREATAARRVARARAEEAQRYERLKRKESWGAWVRRAVTVDTVGAGIFAAYVGHVFWQATGGRAEELLSMYGPHALTVLGALLALATLPAALLLQRRRNPQLV